MKTTAARWQGGDRDTPTLTGTDAFHQRKTEPHAFTPGAASPHERLKNRHLLRFGDAGSAIFHFEAMRRHRQYDTAVLGVMASIAQQVAQNRSQ